MSNNYIVTYSGGWHNTIAQQVQNYTLLMNLTIHIIEHVRITPSM